MKTAKGSIEVLYIYAPGGDEEFRRELEKHLKIWQTEQVIALWHEHPLLAETDYSQTIDPHSITASLVLFLVTTDFLASGYCSGIEMKGLMERLGNGEVALIPIIVGPANWQRAPFSHLQALPRDGRPLTSYADIAKDIDHVIEWLLQTS